MCNTGSLIDRYSPEEDSVLATMKLDGYTSAQCAKALNRMCRANARTAGGVNKRLWRIVRGLGFSNIREWCTSVQSFDKMSVGDFVCYMADNSIHTVREVYFDSRDMNYHYGLDGLSGVRPMADQLRLLAKR